MLLFQVCIESRAHFWDQIHSNDLLTCSYCPSYQCYILLLAYSPSPELISLIYHSDNLLILRTPGTQSSVSNLMRPLNYRWQVGIGLSLYQPLEKVIHSLGPFPSAEMASLSFLTGYYQSLLHIRTNLLVSCSSCEMSVYSCFLMMINNKIMICNSKC